MNILEFTTVLIPIFIPVLSTEAINSSISSVDNIRIVSFTISGNSYNLILGRQEQLCTLPGLSTVQVSKLVLPPYLQTTQNFMLKQLNLSC